MTISAKNICDAGTINSHRHILAALRSAFSRSQISQLVDINVDFVTAAMQSGNEEVRPPGMIVLQPSSGANRIIGRRNQNRLQRRTKNAFDGPLPSLVYLNLVCQRSDEMKVFSLTCGESFLHCQRIMRTSIIEFLETLPAMQRPRMVIAHSP